MPLSYESTHLNNFLDNPKRHIIIKLFFDSKQRDTYQSESKHILLVDLLKYSNINNRNLYISFFMGF